MKKFAARCLFVIAGLATLIAVAYALENWRAKKNWNAYESAQVAKGVELYWKKPTPNNIPDDQNFSTTPLLKAIGKKRASDKSIEGKINAVNGKTGSGGGDYWNQKFNPLLEKPTGNRKDDAKLALNKFDPINGELKELYGALTRPHNFFPLTGEDPLTVDVPNFVGYRILAQAIQTHASANLALGNSETALRDLEVLLALSRGLDVHPVLVSAMVSVALYGQANQVIWEGLALKTWNLEQLVKIEKLLSDINLLQNFDRAMRLGEKAGINSIARNLKPNEVASVVDDETAGFYLRFLPSGLRYQNMLVYNRLVDDYALQGYDVKARTIKTSEVDDNTSRLLDALKVRGPYNYLSQIGIPNFGKALQTIARNQASIHMAMQACELEKTGNYPRELQSTRIDPTTGKPLLYRPDGSRYVIYSAGWNAKDDGGTIPDKVTLDSADWVWAYPQSN